MRISDWSSDVCSSDLLSTREMLASVDWHLLVLFGGLFVVTGAIGATSLSAQAVSLLQAGGLSFEDPLLLAGLSLVGSNRSEEHTSELKSLMRISYAVFCL